MIIGIDHGYGCIKTANCVFTTGITEYEKEPYTSKNVIKYDGKYYVCGSGRQALIRDKTQDDSYYILTLCALAKEFNIETLAIRQMWLSQLGFLWPVSAEIKNTLLST